MKSLRQSRGLYIWNAFKQGKMGVDAYFILFALVGMAVLPWYLYNNLRPNKLFFKNSLGITKESMPDVYRQDKYDLDEISVQKTYYNLFSHEIEQEKTRQIKLAELKKSLEEKNKKH